MMVINRYQLIGTNYNSNFDVNLKTKQNHTNVLNSTNITRNTSNLINIGINVHLVTAELLSALAWHSKSSGKISKNGISLPVCGSMHVFFRARYVKME